MSYNPIYVDWDFLVLLETDDLDTEDIEPSGTPTVTPLIFGLVALIKLYVCAIAFRADKLPGNPRYGRFLSSISSSPMSAASSPRSADASSHYGTHELTLEQGLSIVKDVRSVISQLPEDLKLFNSDGRTIKCTLPFAILRASVYITSLFIQSIVLATLSAKVPSSQRPNGPGSQIGSDDASQSPREKEVHHQLLELRNHVTHESFYLVVATPSAALKANGIAIVSLSGELQRGTFPAAPEADTDRLNRYQNFGKLPLLY